MAGALDFADEPIDAAAAAGAGRQGTRFRRVVTITTGGEPYPFFDGDLVRMQVRQLPTSTDVLLDLDLDHCLALDVDAAQVTIDVPATEMADVTASGAHGHHYDLEIVPGGDEESAFALLAGRFVVKAEVTKEQGS